MFFVWALFVAAALGRPWPTPLELRSQGTVRCDVCRAFAALLEFGFRANLTETELLHEASLLCSRILPNFSQPMCDGIIQQRFGRVVYAILVKLGGKLPEACEYIGACPSTAAPKQRRHGRREREVEKRSRGEAVKYFVQLSDVHFDQFYAEGSSQTCDFTLCCRAEMGTSPPPLAGHFGSYGSPVRTFGCDSPVTLLQSAFGFIAQLPVPITAVLLTGDYVSHDIWQNNVTEMVSEVQIVTQLARNTLKAPLLPISGNHEYFPADQFIIPQAGTQTRTEDLLNAYADTWSFLGVNETQSLREGGFYTTLIVPGLRYVGLNSQYGDSINFWLYATNGLTGGPNQTAWFEQVLSDARDAGEKVIVAVHMPCNHNAGIHDFYCETFLDVVHRYADVLALVVSGHTHADSWVDLGPVTQFVTPSITPFSQRNPSFRIFATDEQYELVRIDTYYLDLERANALGKAEWQLEYSLPAAYGMPDLTPGSFNNVASQLLTNATLWAKWNLFHDSSRANSTFCTESECKISEFCTLTSPTLVDWNACIDKCSAQK
jgi:sphingomyelin phosphodiesterase